MWYYWGHLLKLHMSLTIHTHPDSSITIYGYCEGTQQELDKLILRRSFGTVQSLKGEFTIVHQREDNITIITSLIGAIQYFYYYDGNRFSHGSCILDIVEDMGLGWEWDWESVGDLCEQEYLTMNRTMHKSIKKVPAGSILTFRNKLVIRTTNLLDTIPIRDANPLDAIQILNEETARLMGDQPVLSLSGGFDSRLILSSMLKQGIHPRILTLGNEGTSDMEVAKSIISDFSLEHLRVNLDVEDLLKHGQHIARITNGAKPACHWHTYIYPKKAGMTKDHSFFVGTLGEFARSYYFDKGFLSLLNEGFTSFSQRRLWYLRLLRHRTFSENETKSLCDSLSSQVSSNGIIKRAFRNAKLSKGDFMAGNTRFYLEQRVAHFYANGISMYNDTTLWRSPFHNIDWLRIIWCLSDQWKLGSNWHRLAIEKNYPKLLDFSEEKGLSRKYMLKKAPPLYWLPITQRNKYNNYDMSQQWYQDTRIKELIMDNRGYLDQIIEPELCESIVTEHRKFKTRTRAISFLLSIIYFKSVVSKKGI